MATVVQSHETECALCTNNFKTPKILPCGHILCRECVVTWLDSKSDAGCPLCTCPIVEHQDNSPQSSADVADGLPTDYVMEAIVESSHLLVKHNMCIVCDDVRAEYICIQCLEKMCPSCMKIHKKMSATRSHDVESLSTVTPERLAASRPALCADHGDKQGELFCASHRHVICTSCGSNNHNECPDVKHLDEQMESAGNALGSLTKELAKAEDNLKQTIGNLTVRIETADINEQHNMALVDKTCDQLQKMVEECRKQLKKLISDSFSKFKNSLCDVKRDLVTRLGKVTSHKHLVTRATTVRPRPALIHAAQTLTDRVHNLNLRHEMETEAWVNPSTQIAKYCDDAVKRIKAELQILEQNRSRAEAPVLVFHEKCGSNILLTNGKTTAREAQRKLRGNGAVVSRDAMDVNVLYEVKIDEIEGAHCIYLGVTETPPAQLTWTKWTEDLEESVIIWYSGIRRKGYSIVSNIGNALKCIKVGSRVGLLVDSSNDLHLYVDGHDQGVATQKVAGPCFTIIDLSMNIIQVTALPTSKRM